MWAGLREYWELNVESERTRSTPVLVGGSLTADHTPAWKSGNGACVCVCVCVCARWETTQQLTRANRKHPNVCDKRGRRDALTLSPSRPNDVFIPSLPNYWKLIAGSKQTLKKHKWISASSSNFLHSNNDLVKATITKHSSPCSSVIISHLRLDYIKVLLGATVKLIFTEPLKWNLCSFMCAVALTGLHCGATSPRKHHILTHRKGKLIITSRWMLVLILFTNRQTNASCDNNLIITDTHKHTLIHSCVLF